MNALRANRFIRFTRFFRELLVIFVSIMLAFLVDDYRENKNNLSAYKETLLNFEQELLESIEGKSELDTFRVNTDRFGGRKFARLLNLLWLDSLIDSKTATLSDIRFIIESGELSAELYGSYDPSPLAEELRLKHGESVKNNRLLKSLRIYEDEMQILQRLHQSMQNDHRSIYDLIMKTNPYYQFSEKDSMLFYSNEFISRYKEIVEGRKQEYIFTKWLFQERFIMVLSAIHKEFETLGIPVENSSKCPALNNFYQRFECQNDRPVNAADSLRNIMNLVKKNRTEFISSINLSSK